MKIRHKRLAVIVISVAGLTIAALFVLNAFRSNLVFFYSPTEVLHGKAPLNRRFRIGGLVEKGSVKKSGMSVDFIVTDLKSSIPVHYDGTLPDLFHEGRGVVAEGKLVGQNRFVADEVLAKHDEKYRPPEVTKALEQAANKP
jgi:cytochrome c-type biogenesis protein CcmE